MEIRENLISTECILLHHILFSRRYLLLNKIVNKLHPRLVVLILLQLILGIRAENDLRLLLDYVDLALFHLFVPVEGI